MIKLHKLNDEEIVLNVDFIENIEAVPDTRIILYNGNQYIVKESVDEVIEKIKQYKREIYLGISDERSTKK